MPRRTKIVATIGPASASSEQLAELANAGMDGARLNLSHGTHDEHRERARLIRATEAEVGRPIAVIADLQGPKLRIGELDGPVTLARGVDFVALSFVRSAADVRDLRALIEQAGSHAKVIAKIEKAEAVDALEAVLDETDSVMVARGDLGGEIGPALVPLLQKRIIVAALERGKPVITATQMLETMVHQPEPTRAEASDVANAVLDGSSALMLSGE